MHRFRLSSSLWPAPQFPGDSRDGFAAWIIEREASLLDKHDEQRIATIRQIIETHHDRNGRTIRLSQRGDVLRS
jgi:hypothetical protein